MNWLPPELAALPLWRGYQPTPLIELPALAQCTGVARVWLKLEGERPLGSFKVLGGVWAGLRALQRAGGNHASRRLLCASDGNHGLAVAAAAQAAGARATIYLARGVNPKRAARIEAQGAEVRWIAGTYDDAVTAAATAADRGEGLLIPDTSPDPDDPVVHDVMSGYAQLPREVLAQLPADEAPSHLFVQAGVGGLAAAMADGLRDAMRAPRRVVVVEPTTADCVAQALAAGHPVQVEGELATRAEMLSCGLASAAALRVLLRHEARAVTVSEDQLDDAVQTLRSAGGPATTPSGATGLAGLMRTANDPALRDALELDAGSRVLLVITEGAGELG